MQKAIQFRIAFWNPNLQGTNIFCLPALRSLSHFEFNCLTLLQALESARLDCGEMYKYVFARLTADKAVALGVIEPLYCSLFHKVSTIVPLLNFTLEGVGKNWAGY